jgi:hypothetical protein
MYCWQRWIRLARIAFHSAPPVDLAGEDIVRLTRRAQIAASQRMLLNIRHAEGVYPIEEATLSGDSTQINPLRHILMRQIG